jgi:hypothetical protein
MSGGVQIRVIGLSEETVPGIAFHSMPVISGETFPPTAWKRAYLNTVTPIGNRYKWKQNIIAIDIQVSE